MNSITATAVIDDAQPTAADARRIIFSSSIGNALEWYDFLIYGYFAATIGKLFFPTQSEQVSLLLAVGSFGVAFLMRPIGAIVLGIYADRMGRKASLTLSILLMVLATFAITVMPSYNSIGLAAPFLVILARLVQSFAVGGEFGSATAFMTEQGANRRGFFAS
jgi:MHS family proline/betaine transporter-like MFS transporter